jgi:uncharacterized membrane protein
MTQSKPARQPRLTPRFQLRHTGEYFLRGILVVAPTIITLSALYWLFLRVDGLLHPYVLAPGIGFILILASILVIGWFSTFHVIKRVFRHVNQGIERTPGVGFIYTSVRDFFEAFVGNKKRFTHAVLVRVFEEDAWMIGFLTDEAVVNFDLPANFVSVYVPQSYTLGGQLYLLPRERIRAIENLSPADVMKYAVAGGAVEIVAKDT